MTALRAHLHRLLGTLEEQTAPLWSYGVLFVAILSVRLTLEFISNQRLFTLGDVLHISAWFACVVLAYVLQLHAFSRVPMARVLRMAIPSYAFSWSAPLLDLLLGTPGARMTYLSLRTPGDIAYAYVTLGGASMVRGATLGIRIEIAALVVATYEYIRARSGSRLRGVVGAWSAYTVMFVSGGVGPGLHALVQTLGLAHGPDDQSALTFLIVGDLGLLLLMLARVRPEASAQWLARVPWGVVLAGVGHAAWGAVLAHARYPTNVTLTPTTLWWPPLVAVGVLGLAGLAGVARAPSPEHRAAGSVCLTALVVLSAAPLGTRFCFAMVLLMSLMWLWGFPPLEARRSAWAGGVLVALCMPVAAVCGFAALGGPLIGFPSGAAWGAALLAGGVVALDQRAQGRWRVPLMATAVSAWVMWAGWWVVSGP